MVDSNSAARKWSLSTKWCRDSAWATRKNVKGSGEFDP